MLGWTGDEGIVSQRAGGGGGARRYGRDAAERARRGGVVVAGSWSDAHGRSARAAIWSRERVRVGRVRASGVLLSRRLLRAVGVLRASLALARERSSDVGLEERVVWMVLPGAAEKGEASGSYLVVRRMACLRPYCRLFWNQTVTARMSLGGSRIIRGPDA